MKGKGLAATLLVLTILIGMLGISLVFSVPGVCPVDDFAVSPATTEWTEPAHTIGDTFSFNVTAHNLTDFFSWSVAIIYNTSVLNYTGYEWGDFSDYVDLNPYIPRIEGTINTTTGETYRAWAEAADMGQSVTMTSLRLITFNFEVVGYGTSYLHFQAGLMNAASNVELQTYEGPTDFALENGTFSFQTQPVGGVWVPVDKFGLLAPYIGLVSTIVVATVAIAIYKRRLIKTPIH